MKMLKDVMLVIAGAMTGIVFLLFCLDGHIDYRVIVTNEKQISEAIPEKALQVVKK